MTWTLASSIQELLEQRRLRLVRKQELGKRRSAASQHRMRIISLLGAEESLQTKKKTKQSKEDTFGMDDDDWNVYRTIVSPCQLVQGFPRHLSVISSPNYTLFTPSQIEL